MTASNDISGVRNNVPMAFTLTVIVVGLCMTLLWLAPSLHRAPLLHYALIAYLLIRVLMVSYSPRSAASLLMLHWFTLFGAMMPLLFQYQGDSFFYQFMASEHFDILGPIIVVVLFAVCVDLGHYLTAHKWVHIEPQSTELRIRLRAVLGMLVIANILVAGAMLHFGLSYLTATRLEQFLEYQVDGVGFFFFDVSMRIMLYWCFVLAVLVVRDAINRDGLFQLRSLACVIVLLCIVVEIAIFSNPVATPRFLLLGLVFMVMLAVFSFKTPVLRLGLVAGAAVALYVVFPVLGSASRTDEIVWVLNQSQLIEYLSHLDFDNGAQLLMGYRFAQEQGYYHGLNILSAVLVLVPRSIWPDKSDGVGAAIITYFGGTFKNVSAPLYLEFFIDFGFVGVAVYSLVLGLLLGWVNSAAAQAGRYTVPWMLNIALFATMPLLVRGAVMTGTVALYAHAFAAISWYLISKRTRLNAP